MALLLSPFSVPAQLPEQLLLLVNAESHASKTIANHFLALRGIPENNVLSLNLPSQALGARAEITPSDFERYIWRPVQAALRERDLEEQIVAWVYSADFPIRCLTQPPTSLQGATFVRGESVPTKVTREGRFISSLFAGPTTPSERTSRSQAFEWNPLFEQSKPPVPSMMLGYTGARGSELSAVLTSLKRGHQADGSHPQGTIYFVTDPDVRSKCREWQYPMAVRQLDGLGVKAAITRRFPSGKAGVLGLMAGRPWVNPFSLRGAYLDGAMAEHLTSAAAYFHDYDQTKLSSWIHAGATATAGTVTEPLAIWTKFPSASFFVHYARGCTMMESFFQSVSCPLQLLLVGDPLAQPYRQTHAVALTLTEGTEAMRVTVSRPIHSKSDSSRLWRFFLDGKLLRSDDGGDHRLLPLKTLADGHHKLTVWGSSQAPGAGYWRGETNIVVNRHGRSVTLMGIKRGVPVDADRTLRLRILSEGSPVEVGIRINGRVWARTPAEEQPDLVLRPADMGSGPIALVAVAWYADGMEVRAPPVLAEVSVLNKKPNILDVVSHLDSDGVLRLTVTAEDPDGDRIQVGWGERVEPSAAEDAVWRVVPQGKDPAYILLPKHPEVRAFSAEMRISLDKSLIMRNQDAGLVFDFRKTTHWDYWGLFGGESAWAVGERRRKASRHTTERGAFVRPERWHRLSVRQTGRTGIEARVNGVRLFQETKHTLGAGRLGLFARRQSAEFRKVTVTPPLSEGVWVDGVNLFADPGERGKGRKMVARVSDGYAWIERLVPLDQMFREALPPDP